MNDNIIVQSIFVLVIFVAVIIGYAAVYYGGDSMLDAFEAIQAPPPPERNPMRDPTNPWIPVVHQSFTN